VFSWRLELNVSCLNMGSARKHAVCCPFVISDTKMMIIDLFYLAWTKHFYI
jgi:hypothetical protein